MNLPHNFNIPVQYPAMQLGSLGEEGALSPPWWGPEAKTQKMLATLNSEQLKTSHERSFVYF